MATKVIIFNRDCEWWRAVSRVLLVCFVVLENYEEAWAVKYENIVKYFKKHEIMNATDVVEDAVVLEKV